MLAVFPYYRRRLSCSRVLSLFPLGPCPVKRPFFRSLYRQGLVARHLGHFFSLHRCRVVRASSCVVLASSDIFVVVVGVAFTCRPNAQLA